MHLNLFETRTQNKNYEKQAQKPYNDKIIEVQLLNPIIKCLYWDQSL